MHINMYIHRYMYAEMNTYVNKYVYILPSNNPNVGEKISSKKIVNISINSPP
jgi:3-phenylpropionate/cinnamic acid dioxygenase small subunit